MKEETRVPVRTLKALALVAKYRRSVVCPTERCFAGPMPAAFVLHLQGDIILRLLNSGMYMYRNKAQRKLWGEA